MSKSRIQKPLNVILAGFFGVCSGISFAASGEPVSSCGVVTNGLQVCISLSSSEFAAIEPIIVDLIVSNSSEKAFMIAVGRPEWVCDIEVMQVGEGKIAQTRFGVNAAQSIRRANPKPWLLKPGECRHDPILLNRYFDMSVAGIYRVSITRRLSMPSASQGVIANSGDVEIRVIDEVPGGRSAWGGE